MSPLPALKTLAVAFVDWARKAPKLLPLSLPGIICALLIVYAAYRALPVLADRTITLGAAARTGAHALAVVVAAMLLFCALSWAWRAADRVLYGTQQWISSPFSCLSAVFILGFPLIGLTFIGWLLVVAVAPRIGGPAEFDPQMLWPPGAMERAYLIVAGGWLLLCLPLLLRLYYAPVITALEEGDAKGAFSTVMRTTKGKTLPLLATAIPQLALCALIVLLIARALQAPGPVAALVPLVPCAIAISLLSTLQVAVLRHFVGLAVPGTTDVELDFEVAAPASLDDRPAEAPKTAITKEQDPAAAALPDLPEALKPRPEDDSAEEEEVPPPISPIEEVAGSDPLAAEPAEPAAARTDDGAGTAAERFFAALEQSEGTTEEEEKAPGTPADRFFASVASESGASGGEAAEGPVAAHPQDGESPERAEAIPSSPSPLGSPPPVSSEPAPSPGLVPLDEPLSAGEAVPDPAPAPPSGLVPVDDPLPTAPPSPAPVRGPAGEAQGAADPPPDPEPQDELAPPKLFFEEGAEPRSDG